MYGRAGTGLPAGDSVTLGDGSRDGEFELGREVDVDVFFGGFAMVTGTVGTGVGDLEEVPEGDGVFGFVVFEAVYDLAPGHGFGAEDVVVDCVVGTLPGFVGFGAVAGDVGRVVELLDLQLDADRECPALEHAPLLHVIEVIIDKQDADPVSELLRFALAGLL